MSEKSSKSNNLGNLPGSDSDYWEHSRDNQQVDLDSISIPSIHNRNVRRKGQVAIFSVGDTECAVQIDWDRYDIEDGRIVLRKKDVS